MRKDIRDKLVGVAKAFNRLFVPQVGPEKKYQERIELSNKSISKAYIGISDINYEINRCKALMIQNGKKEPFINDPEFTGHGSVIKAFRVPKLFLPHIRCEVVILEKTG